MSELSTVAIKDGHRGHPHHHSHRQQTTPSDNTDAERADRISRLAGLERLSTVRQSSNALSPAPAAQYQPQGYFDGTQPTGIGNVKERSTVGSASATGSVGGRTTWASGSDVADVADATDKTSEDQDMETSSVGGFSDEGNGSLVGFGEGASSTVSGPVSTVKASQRPGVPTHARIAGMPPPSRDSQTLPMTGVTPTGSTSDLGQRRDARMIDGMTYDVDVVDTSHEPSAMGGMGAEAAEQIMSASFEQGEGGMNVPGGHGVGSNGLGTFPFEEYK